jgi:hypothetical protein
MEQSLIALKTKEAEFEISQKKSLLDLQLKLAQFELEKQQFENQKEQYYRETKDTPLPPQILAVPPCLSSTRTCLVNRNVIEMANKAAQKAIDEFEDKKGLFVYKTCVNNATTWNEKTNYENKIKIEIPRLEKTTLSVLVNADEFAMKLPLLSFLYSYSGNPYKNTLFGDVLARFVLEGDVPILTLDDDMGDDDADLIVVEGEIPTQDDAIVVEQTSMVEEEKVDKPIRKPKPSKEELVRQQIEAAEAIEREERAKEAEQLKKLNALTHKPFKLFIRNERFAEHQWIQIYGKGTHPYLSICHGHLSLSSFLNEHLVTPGECGGYHDFNFANPRCSLESDACKAEHIRGTPGYDILHRYPRTKFQWTHTLQIKWEME